MPALLDPAPSLSAPPIGSSLIDAMLPAAPGTIVQLDLGTNLLFAGCGKGETLLELAGLFPRSRFLGVDSSVDALTAAQQSARIAGRSNIQLGRPDIVRRANLQGIFNYVIRLNGTASLRLDSLPALMRDGALLFDVADTFCSPSAYHDAGLIIIRTFRLQDGRACVLAGNWTLPPARA
jgi:SAM-dependent methyltransferase